MHDRECIRFTTGSSRLSGSAPISRTCTDGSWPLSWDDRLELETLVRTDYAGAVSSLTAAIAPVVRRHVEALGALLPLADDMAIDLMPEEAYLTFLEGVFAEAGIADRFNADTELEQEPTQLHSDESGPEDAPDAS